MSCSVVVVCKQEYTCETGDSLRHQMVVHIQQIRNANIQILHVSNHTAIYAKDYDIKFKLLPVYKLKGDSTIIYKMKRAHFIPLSLSLSIENTFTARQELPWSP